MKARPERARPVLVLGSEYRVLRFCLITKKATHHEPLSNIIAIKFSNILVN